MRRSGILMPVSALPSPWGTGTMGKEAEAFIDFLHDAGQAIWQILPIGPTGFGDSPYQSLCSAAGNPYLIDFDALAADGLLERAEYADISWGEDPLHVDYGALYRGRFDVLRHAVAQLEDTCPRALAAFCEREASWLDDYALFMALKEAHGGAPWSAWSEKVRRREPAALDDARRALADQVRFWQGVQFLFFEQWDRLHARARKAGVSILGDLPIYVAEDSCDVWAHPEQFQLDDDLRPIEVSGCPPDGYAATGQLWGNPLYRWDAMAKDGYSWWIDRVKHQLRFYDILRIDHFRGFESYYAIPAGAPDASVGTWRPGPGIALFQAITEALGTIDIVAEDLGFLTPAVHELLDASGYPGMKVLEFAFDRRDGGGRAYQPHTYPTHCVAYVGTHDNDTARGWLETADPADAAYAREYLGLNTEEGEHWGFMRGIWASAADTAIVQMQDVLGLGSETRMNVPSTVGTNWQWRAPAGFTSPELATRLHHLMDVYDRLPCTEDAREDDDAPAPGGAGVHMIDD